MQRRLLLGIAAGGVLAVTGGLFVLDGARDPGTFRLTSEPFETGSPTPTPSASYPTATRSATAYPTPSVTTGAPTAVPTATASRTALPTVRPTTPVPTSYRPVTGRALPTCNASFGNACTYPGAKKAVTGGVRDLDCRLTGPTSIRVGWDSANLDGDAPVDEFVLRLWRHPQGSSDPNPDMRGYDRLYQVRVDRNTFDVTVNNLVKGERYACFVQELNVAGLSPAIGVEHILIPGGTPSPTQTPSPTETPSETPSP